MSKAYSRALGYLTIRSRTVKEITDYLARKGFSETETQETVSKLLEVGLLDDSTTARQWVEYWLACKPLGRDRMRLELQRRGVGRDIIDDILSAIDNETELELATAFLAPRPVHQWTREKTYRFLRYRGFSHAVIERIIFQQENLTQG
jgi:regulatory protein